MAELLVSVRSVAEAASAVDGGAAVIDIKEPDRGPLGRATVETWRAIRAEVPATTPVSVALGELIDLDPRSIQAPDLAGIAFQKAGPARMGRTYSARWQRVGQEFPVATGWVAVIYADWHAADAPDPDTVITAALEFAGCPGLLIDTWDKHQPSPMVSDERWRDRIQRVQTSGRFVALAGRLDRATIHRLASLQPDLFAVRSAACTGGDRRNGTIDARRVADLVALVKEC